MPFVVVVPELVEPSVMLLPSTTIVSFAPSASPLTVNVRPVIVWPASIVLVDAPLNTDTAAACVPNPAASWKVGFDAVAESVGASLTGTTVTVDAMASVGVSTPPLAVPPLSLIWVRVNTRLPAVGSSVFVS